MIGWGEGGAGAIGEHFARLGTVERAEKDAALGGVSGGEPPRDGMRSKGPPAENRIVLLTLQVAPKGSLASHRVCTGPPVASTFLSLPPAKKPISRPSGDQKGREAPWVPSRRSALSEANFRSQRKGGSVSRVPPPAMELTSEGAPLALEEESAIARLRPSGETAIWAANAGPASSVASGRSTVKRIGPTSPKGTMGRNTKARRARKSPAAPTASREPKRSIWLSWATPGSPGGR